MDETVDHPAWLHRLQGWSTGSPRGIGLLPRIEFWLPIVAILGFCLLISGDPGYAASGGNELYHPRVQSNIVRQIAFLGIGCVGILLLTLAGQARDRRAAAWTILLPVLGLTAYILLSILWSDDPQMTLKRSITAALIVLAGLGIGRVWSYRDLARGILVISTTFLAISLVAELRYRSFLHIEDYRFSGVFHPAKQAFNCGFLILACQTLYLIEGRRWLLVILALACCILIATKARTGTLAAFFAAIWLIWHFRSPRVLVMAAIAGSMICLASVWLYQGATGWRLDATQLATMGRDDEAADPRKLTGRLPIWNHVLKEFSKRPLLGHGYGAFWTPLRLAEFERRNGWGLYHAHSTYFETLVNLGAVGFGLGCLVIALVFHRSARLSRSGNPWAVLASSLLVLSLIGGVSEMAFIGLEYESLILMSAIGIAVFTPSVSASRRA